MKQTLVIFIGGGLGACLRFFITHLFVKMIGTTFPAGILVSNILGCFLMGTALGVLHSCATHPLWHSFIIIGFLGGFTTFSSFTNDCITLFQRGDILLCGLYLVGSIILSLAFLLFGMWLIKIYVA